MSAPLVPSPLDYIGRRSFAFYPPIRNVAPNEWRLGSGTWSEVQVVHVATGVKIWIPRQYIGAVSETAESVMIVGLRKEVEFRSGSIEPRVKRVIEMPQSNSRQAEPRIERPPRKPGPAPVVGIRVEHVDSPMNRALITFGLGAFGMAILAGLLSALTRQ